jgi:hypothetical protein
MIEVIAIRDVLSDRVSMAPQANFVTQDGEALVMVGRERDSQKIKSVGLFRREFS